jgi:hypothetical protein
MKLTPEQRRAILAEMRLAELFTEKMWARRYRISTRTVKRLRAAAREQPQAPNVPLLAPMVPPGKVARCLTIDGQMFVTKEAKATA